MTTKAEVVQTFQTHRSDTGSADVQIALLSGRINALIEHLKKFTKDHSSRRGLLNLVERRRKLLLYIKRVAPESYKKLIDKLNLRK